MPALIILLALVFLPLPTFAVGLNDTGILFCSDDSTNTANCATVSADGGAQPRQDARYGRDAAVVAGKLPKAGAGEGGFDFTALDASGQPTTPTAGASPHPCVRDNLSGLIWEVKTADGGLRDQDWTYSWYDSVHNYSGNAGTANGGICQTTGRCDTEKYVADVNAAALCGYTDWRMPSRQALQGIVHLWRIDSTIDPTYFPNTVSSYFWSGSPAAYYSYNAWFVDFGYGGVNGEDRSHDYRVRLVRGDQ